MGDKLEQNAKLMQDLREVFEREFKLRSVLKMAYDNFCDICVGFLSRTRSQISSRWQELYVLNYGEQKKCLLMSMYVQRPFTQGQDDDDPLPNNKNSLLQVCVHRSLSGGGGVDATRCS